MKRIIFLMSALALVLTACEGDPGPPGPPGFNGLDGVNIVAQSFERTVDFTATNNYEVSLEIPLDIELLETDMVLVYRLLGQIDGFDVWKPLPETVYTDTSEFQYNFEHNFDFVTIYIDAPPSFDFNTLFDDERLGQTFRIVVLPVDFINSNNIDISNYNEVAQFLE